MEQPTKTRAAVEPGRAPPHPLEVLDELERSFSNSRQWRETFLSFRRL